MKKSEIKSLDNYSDEYGNTVIYSGSHKTREAQITFSGNNNKVYIESDASLSKLHIDFLGSNSSVRIGGSSSARCVIRIGSKSEISIGRGLSTTSAVYMTAFEGSSITIGHDCMFAGSVQIRSDDAHPIFDVSTGKRLNLSEPIVIGDHVWLGEGCVILGGAEIGKGSIVGIRSVVKCKTKNNCVVAGVPARIVRKNAAWERPHLSREHLFEDDGQLKNATREFWDQTIDD